MKELPFDLFGTGCDGGNADFGPLTMRPGHLTPLFSDFSTGIIVFMPPAQQELLVGQVLLSASRATVPPAQPVLLVGVPTVPPEYTNPYKCDSRAIREYPDGIQECPGAIEEYPGAIKKYPGAIKKYPGALKKYPGALKKYPGAIVMYVGNPCR